ncbi:MAG: hypothetical protein ACYDDS_02220 [Candidatus Sulfotelmatobacter sp.]
MSTSSILSVIAMLISLIAVCFTGLQWREAHAQLLLSMKPSVNLPTEDDINEGAVGIALNNSGPGPAKIKSINYFIDRKLVGDVNKALDFSNLGPDVHFLEWEEDGTLGVGEKQWLLKWSKRPHTKKDQQELDEFVNLIDHRLAVQVEFCPVLAGDCSKRCSTKGWCQ